ncbi:STAS domain-containing protein [Anaeromyxobacter diazotrophicus]|uniref:STAS domain-containing protein n=1 Tax=Anaeromyxobacter diazotrophicus TaxID=2590199 RepID=A0A7I9VNF1_9BACT|nr:STAS domain-containing protein [Anaeromyxobacter diazotrophicus]GEJ57936.1 hypothetical protein AMYX_26770 [Anaeromyxobacter diazotrophicus]
MGRGEVERWEGDGGVVLRPPEELDRSHLELLWTAASRALRRSPRRIVLDLEGVTPLGAGGVALVRELEHRCQRRGVVAGASPAASAFLEFVRGRSPDRPRAPHARRTPGAVPLARKAARARDALRAFVEFVGRFTASAGHLAARPGELRVHDALYQLQRAGADGMWLIGGLSVLLGVIMAFQGPQATTDEAAAFARAMSGVVSRLSTRVRHDLCAVAGDAARAERGARREDPSDAAEGR